MMNKLFAIIEKDVRQLVHSKSSALIILISPIVLMILAGLALSSSGLSGVKVGVFLGADPAALGEGNIGSVLDAKMAEKGFSVQYFSNLNKCKQSVKDETTHICVEVAEKADTNLAKIDPRLMYQVNFYVDYSKVRLVWAIVNAIRTIVAQENTKISTEITTKLSDKINFAVNEITKNQGKLDEIIRKGEGIRNTFSSGIRTLNEMSSYISETRTISGSVIETSDSISTNLNDLLSYSSDARRRLSDLSRLNPALASSISAIQGNLDSIDGFANNIATVNNGLEEKARRLDSRLDEISMNQNNVASSLTNAEPLLDDLLDSLREVKSGIDKLEREFAWARNIKATDIMNPIPVEVLPLSGEVTEVGSVSSALTYLDYLLPALVILVIMFVATLISSTMVIKERKSVAYFRNLIAPTNSSLYVVGVYLIGLILVGMQATLLVLVASFFFGVIISSYLSIALVLLLTISIFVLLGVIIGYLFNSEETTMMGAISLALVCLLFSALIIPLETMPGVMRAVAQFSPFVIAETALRKIMIFGIPIINREAGTIMMEPVKLAVIAAVLFAGALVLQNFKNKKEI
ncbi:MAG TPA: ABC transporter permease [Nanoarchaeota archaeon]|nr:ABC transporter permease [Nanoarchaeota archaeon]